MATTSNPAHRSKLQAIAQKQPPDDPQTRPSHSQRSNKHTIARAQKKHSHTQGKSTYAHPESKRPAHDSVTFFTSTAAQFQKSIRECRSLNRKIDDLISKLSARLEVLVEQDIVQPPHQESTQIQLLSRLESLAQDPSLAEATRNIQDILAVIDSLKQECLSIDSDYQIRTIAINDGQLARETFATNIIQKHIQSSPSCVYRKAFSLLIEHADKLRNTLPDQQPSTLTEELRSILEKLYEKEGANYLKILADIINAHKSLNSETNRNVLKTDFRAALMSRYSAQQATINGLLQRYYAQLKAEYHAFNAVTESLVHATEKQLTGSAQKPM